jgi:hypothetical protein
MKLPKFVRRLWMPLLAVLILALIATIELREPFVVAATASNRPAAGGTGAAAPRTGNMTGAAAGGAVKYAPCVAPYSSYDGTERCQTPAAIMPRTAPCPAGPNGVVGTRHSSGKCGIARPRAA